MGGMEAPSEHHDKGLAFDGAGAVYINVGPPSNACQVKDRTKGSPGQDPAPSWTCTAGSGNSTPAS